MLRECLLQGGLVEITTLVQILSLRLEWGVRTAQGQMACYAEQNKRKRKDGYLGGHFQMESSCWSRRQGWGQTADLKHQSEDVTWAGECSLEAEIIRNRVLGKAQTCLTSEKIPSLSRWWVPWCHHSECPDCACQGMWAPSRCSSIRKARWSSFLNSLGYQWAFLQEWSMVPLRRNTKMLVENAHLQGWLCNLEWNFQILKFQSLIRPLDEKNTHDSQWLTQGQKYYLRNDWTR